MSAAPALFTELTVGELHCPSCAAAIEGHLKQIGGVTACQVNFAAARVGVGYNPNQVTLPQIEAALERIGHPVRHPDAPPKQPHTITPQRLRGLTTALAGFLLSAAFVARSAGAPPSIWIVCYALSLAGGGAYIARNAWIALRRRRTADINTLMVVAAAGAAAMGDWPEAATILFLFSIAELLEAYSIDRTRQAVRGMMDLAPEVATVSSHGREQPVPVQDVREGQIILIRPGGRVPLDGAVIEGRSAVNEAAITGESIPKPKGPGDSVYAGTLNEAGRLAVRVTHRVGDTTLARIVSLIEAAQAQRSPTEKLIDRFARYYTPAILALALLLAAVPPLLGADLLSWIYRSLTLLIISCPCALVISTPVAIVCGIARAARSGVLIKGGVHLERLATLKALAFDKTGTLTEGQPTVTDIVPLDGSEADTLLALAASIEDGSEHALGRAVLQAARHRGLTWPPACRFEAVAGAGIRAEDAGVPVVVGRPSWLRELGFDLAPGRSKQEELEAEGKTVVLVAKGNSLAGLIAMADRPRDGGEAVVRSLRRLGIAHVAMLTGDSPSAAATVAAAAGISEYHAGLMPADKVELVQRLQREAGAVAMVGDGINDAPALAAASVGIAMGAAGTDVALETADVALMGDDLSRLPVLIRLSRRTLTIVRQNIAFAVIVKAAFIALTLAGLSSLWLAVLADTGTTVLVVLNSLRLLRVSDRHDSGAPCCKAAQ